MKTRSVAFLLCAALILGAAASDVQANPRRAHPGRSHVGRSHVGRTHPHRTQLHFGFSFGYPFFGYYPGYAYYPYYPYFPYDPYGPGWGAYPAYAGFVDLDVEPEEAEVWMGDRLVGTADDFDGFPDLLPLRPGKRTIVLRHPGYEDLKLRLQVMAGTKIRIRRSMVPVGDEPE